MANRRPREPMRPPWPAREVVLFEATDADRAEAPPEGTPTEIIVPFRLFADLRERPLCRRPVGWQKWRILPA